MYTIKGFTTKGKTPQDIAKEAVKAGCKDYKMPFEATSELDVDKDPFDGTGVTVDDYSGDPQKIKINT